MHMQNLRNKQAKGKRERERDKPRNRLIMIENKLMATRGEGHGRMGEIGDGDFGVYL